MKKILLLLILILLLGGGGFAGYAHFVAGQSPKKLALQLAGKAPAEGAEKDVATAEEPTDTPLTAVIDYIDMQPIVVPVMYGGSVARFSTAQIKLEVHSAEARAAVEANMPRLRDDYFRVLYAVSSMPSSIGGTMDAAVKARLQQLSDEVLGEGVIKGVMLQPVAEQDAL